MKREIYEVHMTYINSEGVISVDPKPTYPIIVDSMECENDVEKALRLAKGYLGAAESEMSMQDNRQKQYAYIIRVSDGLQIEKREFGKIADLPDPEPDIPEEETEGGEE